MPALVYLFPILFLVDVQRRESQCKVRNKKESLQWQYPSS